MRAAQSRGPSRRLSTVLIALGAIGGLTWMALPGLVRSEVSVAEIVRDVGSTTPREDALGSLLALEEQAYPGLVPMAAHGTFEDGVPLSVDQQALVDAALSETKPRALIAYLRRSGPAQDMVIRAYAMQTIGARGLGRDVYALFDLAEGEAQGGGGESVLTVALEASLRELFTREPTALDELRGGLDEFKKETLKPAVRAIGGSKRSRAIGVLLELVGTRADFDSQLLAEIGRLGDVAEPEAARVAALRIHPFLEHKHPGMARAAANALGRLGDPDPIETLIGLLASDDAGLAKTAHVALKHLTRLELRASNGPWIAWYSEQRAWIDTYLDQTLDRLGDASNAVVLEAVRELLAHPLERHLIADEIAGLLTHPDETIRLAAADACRRLRSRAAVDALLPSLEDQSAEVAAAAREALIVLLGEDHGEGQDAWREAISARR